jgi:hypothetical protein
VQNDAESKFEPPAGPDLWELPKIEAVKIERVRYRTPRKHVVEGRVVEFEEGIEILVETDADIPMRALAPALHVGSAEIAENDRTSPNSHRFFVLDEETLRPGDPITLGWVGHPARDADSPFRYEPPSNVARKDR